MAIDCEASNDQGHERTPNGRIVSLDDGPRALPAEAMDRMRMVAEVSCECVHVAVERELRVGDSVRVRDEWIASVTADVALPASDVRRRPQHVPMSKREFGDGAADVGRD